MQFRNRYTFLQQQEKNTSTERKAIFLECYMHGSRYPSSEFFIDIINLEIKYSELMKSYNIQYPPHITCFLEKLKYQVLGLSDQKIGKNCIFL